MSSTSQYISAAQKALRSFLTTLLGQEAPLSIKDPETIALDAVVDEAPSYLKVSYEDNSKGFTVLLDPDWLPLLSESMLGEALTVDDPDYADLVQELAGQGYSSIRTQFSTMGLQLPMPSFGVDPPGSDLPVGHLQHSLWRLTFSMNVDGRTFGGYALLPAQEGATTSTTSAPTTSAVAETSFGGDASGQIEVAPVNLPDLGKEALGVGGSSNFELLSDVELEVRVELGRRRLPLADLIRLTHGSVIELEKLVGEPLEVYANGRLIAEGEAVVIEEQFGVRITRLITNRKPQVSFRAA